LIVLRAILSKVTIHDIIPFAGCFIPTELWTPRLRSRDRR
jgi:hypothetical protein